MHRLGYRNRISGLSKLHLPSTSSAAVGFRLRHCLIDFTHSSIVTLGFLCGPLVLMSGGHAASGALKLVGEGFPWTRDSCFAYTRDNHNSVLGIREQARFPSRSHHLATCRPPLRRQSRWCTLIVHARLAGVKLLSYGLLCIEADTAASMQALSAGACAQAVDPEPSAESAAGWALPSASTVMRRSRPRQGVAAADPADPAAASSAADDSTTISADDGTASGQRGRAVVSSSPAAVSEEPPWHLFAFPLESNFSGMRYDEGLGNAAAAELNEGPVLGASEAGDDAREGCAVGMRPRRGRWRTKSHFKSAYHSLDSNLFFITIFLT